jgi:cytochrome c oxidase cbb3-type subunit 1
MNATSSSSSSVSDRDSVSNSEIDASCRTPLFALFVGAAVWLVFASLLGLIASLKFHSPNILADCASMTYGRVRPAANDLLLYGFAIPAGLGTALWIIARLGRTPLAQPWLIVVGAKLWHLGVLVGLICILDGDGTGFEALEMPRYAAVFLILGFLVIGIWAVLTLHDRRERELQPPQWFLLTALFWFPWIFCTAYLLLTVWPVRGVTQAIIAWWYGNNLTFVWLGLTGLAATFHFIPQFIGRPLQSRHLALFTFWSLILFGSWCGIPHGAPVPAWMPALSGVASVLTVVTLISLGLNIFRTKSGAPKPEKCAGAAPFFFVGLGLFQLAGLLRAASGLPQVSAITQFTWFTVAQWQLAVYGFFALTMFGAVYHIVPQVTGLDWPSVKLIRAHFWLATAGIVLFALPLAIGGVVQGLKLNDPTIAFNVLTKSTVNFLRISTLGDTCILIGSLFFVVNLTGLSVRYYRTHFLPAYRDAVTPLKPAEVKP